MSDLASQLKQPGFLPECARRYHQLRFEEVQESEYRSWRSSWPALVKALLGAGLGEMQIYLEYATPGGAGRFDALLLGCTSHGVPALLVIELKQWTIYELLSGRQVRLPDGMQAIHPTAKVAGYMTFLRQWFESGEKPVEVRGLAFLHNATDAQVDPLRAVKSQAEAAIPLLSGQDLDQDLPTKTLRERLLCADLQVPDTQQVAEFENVRWAPSRQLLCSVADMLENKQTFVLVGDQQDAFVQILDAVDQAITDRSRAVVAVTGGPGSGKTVIAARLLARLFSHPGLNPRYLSPSGTLTRQLSRAAGDQVAGELAVKDLFLHPKMMPTQALRGARMAILDEAQRLPRLRNGQGLLRQIIERVPIVVLFLDEQQIIRPDEGITIAELQQMAAACDTRLETSSLSGCFRSNGSRAYAQWVDRLLYATAGPWTGSDFDLGLADDPAQLQAWIDHHAATGATARTAAGFCWPWTRDRTTLRPEVDIRWTDAAGQSRSWQAPWNADNIIGDPPIAPHRNYWATDTGGHQQIGCIYTAQGLEYTYGGTIIGPDLIHRNGTWHAQPQHSHDPAMRGLSPAQYLPLALNIYRVLLTRSTHGMRLYSTDPETQQFLAAHIIRATVSLHGNHTTSF